MSTHESIKGIRSPADMIDAIVLACRNGEWDTGLEALYEKWREEQFGSRRIVAPTPPVQEDVSSGKDAPPSHQKTFFKPGDYLKLEPLNAQSGALIRRWGRWWNFQGRRANETELLLCSMDGQEREAPKRASYTLIIGAKADWNFRIVGRLEFPTETKKIPKEPK